MALLENILQKLTDDGVVDSNWPCYIGLAPDNQNQVLQLAETSGLPEITHDGTKQPAFQVLVRAARYGYSTCRAKWQEVYDSLNDAGWSDTSPDPLEDYALIQAVSSSPLSFYDGNERPNLTVNFQVIEIP